MAEGWTNRNAPSIEDIEHLAQDALEGLPGMFLQQARLLRICVLDFPSEDILESVGLSDGFELTGYYEGVPLTEKSISEQPLAPDSVWLFRRPILDEWVERGNVRLGELVTHIIVHEIAHHFGWSDDDIARIDKWWE